MSSPYDHRCQCCGELADDLFCTECIDCTTTTGKGGAPE